MYNTQINLYFSVGITVKLHINFKCIFLNYKGKIYIQ